MAKPSPYRTAAKIAWRETRASSGRFLFVILAVAAGVGSLTGVRGFSQAFHTVLQRDARGFMAADMTVRTFQLPDAKQLATTGSGRIKKTAINLEGSLVRFGDLAFKLNMRNNDEEITPDPKEDGKPGDPFYYANMTGEYALRVAGHSHSPLFSDDTKELAAGLFKSQAIDQEALLRMMNPPDRDNLLHALRSRQKKQAAAQAAKIKMGIPPEGGKPNGKGKGAHA